MLLKIENTVITHQCNVCKHVQEIDVKEVVKPFIEEFGEYENHMIPCTNEGCHCGEVYNMNLQEDEEFDVREVGRELVKELTRLIRADLKGV